MIATPRRMPSLPLLLLLAVALPASAQHSRAHHQPDEPGDANLLVNPGFEQGTTGWDAGSSAGRYAAVKGPANGGTLLRYEKKEGAGSPNENAHFDQVVSVEAGTLYVAGIRVKATGDLRPVLRIASEGWATIATAAASASADWQAVRTVFASGGGERIRFQLFGGSRGEIRETFPGVSYLDDAFIRPATEAERQEHLTCKVTVRPDRTLREINPLFFGANMLFMIDDDAALADGKIARHLRDMPCRLLRFPGGDVADNYLWRTHSLDNPKHWPAKQGPQTTDTDEFMAFCRQAGAEPIFVVNTETTFVHGDLAAGAQEAADWVRHCNVDHDYNVKLWEIGNETYLYSPGKHKRAAVSAAQYAKAYLQFSAAMKAVDPTIRTGAIGPLSAKATVSLGENRDTGPWWPTLFDAAGDRLDFVVVHDYAPAAFGARNPRAHAIRAFREALTERYPDRHVLLALTEWNLNKRTECTDIEQALLLAERASEYLTGGIDMATFWPLRIGGGAWGKRGLLNLETREPQVPHQLLSMLARAIEGRLVEVECAHPRVCVFACASPTGEVRLCLVNHSFEPEGIAVVIDLSGMQPGQTSCATLTATDADAAVTQSSLPVERRDGQWHCRLPTYTVAVVRFSP